MIYWIDVKERLPKNKNDVIVWDKKANTFREDYYSRGDGMDGWARSHQDAISHWMPKPSFNNLLKEKIKPPKQ